MLKPLAMAILRLGPRSDGMMKCSLTVRAFKVKSREDV